MRSGFISKIRPVKSIELLKILQSHYGYSVRQGRGDHVVLFDSKGHHTVVQVRKELRPNIVSAILKETELRWEDIESYL